MGNRPDRHSAESQAKRDRAFVAEQKVKQLRFECDGLRKQVFRAQEAARIADEEALSVRVSLASMTQSRDAARARNAVLQGRIDTLIERPATLVYGVEAKAERPSLLERLVFWRPA